MGVTDILMRLSTREKAITGLTILVVLAVIPYLFVYLPAQEKISSKHRQLDTLQKEITSLTVSLKDRVGEGKSVDMPAITLPEANDLAKMIEVISQEADNKGVDFIAFTQEGFTYGDQYVQMRLKLELRARYRPFFSFIRTLSDKHRLFMIQSIRYETNEAIYPSGVAIIKAVAYLKRQ